uniref:Uncharacterized protein n=1 Tax=Panagrolaimus superbus TaxID=310955 RepID=A0A914Z2A1_9BILA
MLNTNLLCWKNVNRNYASTILHSNIFPSGSVSLQGPHGHNQKLKIVDDFDALSKECLKSLKEEYIKTVYTKFGTNEKEFLEKRFAKFFDHAVLGGKMTRSHLGFGVFQLLKQDTLSSMGDSKTALKVILSIELLQAVFLVMMM